MDTLGTCTQFFSQALNNKSAALTGEMLPIFLQKFSELISMSESALIVKIKPFGKKCVHCGKYVAKEALSRSIGLWCNPSEHIMCSVACLQRHALICTNFSLLDLNYVTCPRCWTSIHQEQIIEAFGDKFEMIQSDACDKALRNLLNEEGKREMEAKFNCQICMMDHMVSDGITLECDHRFCLECMKAYTTNLVESAQVNEKNLKCPNCVQPLTLYEIEDIVGPELYEKYEKFLLRGFRLGEDSKEFIFYCPKADCEFFCISDADLEEVECGKCFFVCCPKCCKGPHKGISCEEFKKQEADAGRVDHLFEEMLRKEGIINCPSCGAAVQRIDGCEFMVCTSSQCQGRTYFCYDCGVKLAADHAPHPCNKKLLRRPQVPPPRPAFAQRHRPPRRAIPLIKNFLRKGKNGKK